MLDLQGNFFVSTKSFQYIYLVNLTGLRQIGKTTLAGLIAMKTPKVYIRGSDLTSALCD